MVYQRLICFFIISTLLSCDSKYNKTVEINDSLKEYYEFNLHTLHNYKTNYYEMIAEQPSRKIQKLNDLDLKFESLLKKL